MAIIKFGRYPQNNGSFKEPIDWLVLQFKGNEALLVSWNALDCRPYHHEDSDITWENCDLRKWLNSEFLKEAFTPEEQSMIKLSKVVNDDTPEYGTPSGNSTRDRIFCLSFAEAERYFKNDRERICRAAAPADAHGAFTDRHGYCWWWLRTSGYSNRDASFAGTDGALSPCGENVASSYNAVRPALWVKLEGAYLSAEPL